MLHVGQPTWRNGFVYLLPPCPAGRRRKERAGWGFSAGPAHPGGRDGGGPRHPRGAGAAGEGHRQHLRQGEAESEAKRMSEAPASGPTLVEVQGGQKRLWWSKPMGSHFGVGEFTTHFRTYFSGDWDARWGYGILTYGHTCFGLLSPCLGRLFVSIGETSFLIVGC